MSSLRSAALGVPVLKRDEEAALIRSWKAGGSLEAFHRIATAYLRLCHSIARYYTSNDAYAEDLAQEGVFGIRRALEDFDPSYGTRFSTFVRRYIQNAIAEKVSATMYDVSIPSRILLDVRAGRASPDRHPRAFAAAAPHVSLDGFPDADEPGAGFFLADDAPGPLDILVERDTAGHYGRLVAEALESLPQRERDIVVRRHMFDPPDTLDQIGADIGLTRERVRQLDMRALQKIKRHVQRKVGRRGPFT